MLPGKDEDGGNASSEVVYTVQSTVGGIVMLWVLNNLPILFDLDFERNDHSKIQYFTMSTTV